MCLLICPIDCRHCRTRVAAVGMGGAATAGHGDPRRKQGGAGMELQQATVLARTARQANGEVGERSTRTDCKALFTAPDSAVDSSPSSRGRSRQALTDLQQHVRACFGNLAAVEQRQAAVKQADKPHWPGWVMGGVRRGHGYRVELGRGYDGRSSVAGGAPHAAPVPVAALGGRPRSSTHRPTRRMCHARCSPPRSSGPDR